MYLFKKTYEGRYVAYTYYNQVIYVDINFAKKYSDYFKQMNEEFKEYRRRLDEKEKNKLL